MDKYLLSLLLKYKNLHILTYIKTGADPEKFSK